MSSPVEPSHNWLVGLNLQRLAWTVRPHEPQDDARTEIVSQGWWRPLTIAASAWQRCADQAYSWTAWAAYCRNVELDRASELAALMGNTGDQLGVAGAALVEASLWQRHRDDQPAPTYREAQAQAVGDEVAQRAMAEAAMFSLLAVGHSMANVTARLLTLPSETHDFARATYRSGAQNPRTTAFEPGTSDKQAWRSLNADEARKLRKLARAAPEGSVRQALAEPASAVLRSRWTELSRIRDSSWHQLRPRSPGMASSPRTGLSTVADGKRTVRVGGVSTDAPADSNDPAVAATPLTALTLEVADVLVAQLTRLLELWGRERNELHAAAEERAASARRSQGS